MNPDDQICPEVRATFVSNEEIDADFETLRRATFPSLNIPEDRRWFVRTLSGYAQRTTDEAAMPEREESA